MHQLGGSVEICRDDSHNGVKALVEAIWRDTSQFYSQVIALSIIYHMASKNALTEPLLDAEEYAEAHVSTVDNVREAVEESQQLKEQLETNPSYEPLITKPQLEYEPSDIDTAETKQENVENTKFTSDEPVWQTCPYCNTTSETTTVNAFGRCTCLWVCILLVLCFPLCWIPFFWKSVSTAAD